MTTNNRKRARKWAAVKVTAQQRRNAAAMAAVYNACLVARIADGDLGGIRPLTEEEYREGRRVVASRRREAAHG